MKFFLLGMLFFGTQVTPNVAFAQDARPFIRCVQENLTILPEYDPRGIDGIIGPGTRRAAEMFRETNTDLRLRELSRENAKAWCFVMAGAFPSLLKISVIVETNLPQDERIRFRFGGGNDGEVLFGSVPLAPGAWLQSSGKHEGRRYAEFPIGLINRATVFCLDTETGNPIRLLEAKSDLDLKNSTHPNYTGYCRWSGSGRALTNAQNGVEADGEHVVISYLIE